jgi:tetratricopeptide (TPR) repeat protein
LFFNTLHSEKREDKIVYGFFDNEGTRYVKMIIIGETVALEKADTLELDIKNDKSLLEFDTRPDTVTVKILNNPGIRVGQTLFLLEKHHDHDFFKDGNIVAEIKVTSVYNTTFFGQQLRGEGHLRMIENIMTVAMPITGEEITESIITKKQGDYFVKKGDLASAIQYYKKSIKSDPNTPEPHFALAKLHESTGTEMISAAYEYKLANKYKDKFADAEEKSEFYIRYSSFLISKHKREAFKKQTNYDDLKQAISLSSEFQKSKPKVFSNLLNLTEANLMLYLLHKGKDNNSNDRDLIEEFEQKTEKALTASIELNPQSYKIHTFAVYFYLEKLKNLPLKTLTSNQAVEAKDFIQKIEDHSRQYMVYKPKNKKPDLAIMKAKEFIKSLR